MTRKQALQSLDEKFATRLANKAENLEKAQADFNIVIGNKEQKRRQIEAYYDALDKKAEIDSIVNQGEPVIS